MLRQLTGHLGVGAAGRQWCWIAVHSSPSAGASDPNAWQRHGAWQQWLLFYVPIGVVFVFNAVVYQRILKFLAMDPMAAKFKRKVVLYLLVFFLCSIWGVINRLVQFYRPDHKPNEWLSLLECICDPLQVRSVVL